MEEVADLLTAWGIPDMIPTFAKNGITLQSLSALNIDEIKELVPLIGPRALFIRSWKIWLKHFNDENAVIYKNIDEVDIASCNISLSALQDISLLQDQETQTSSPEKAIEKSPNKNVKISPDKTGVTDNLELLKILKENFEATSLVQYIGESLPNENARNLLALVIAKNILKVNKNTSITGAIYNKWCKDIKSLFPGERTTTYYIPACVTAQGVTVQARGKLVSQVLNTRRKYQKIGVLDKRSPSPGSSILPSNTITSEPVSTEADTGIQESLTWLEHSSSPWSLVQSKWTETLESRITYLKEPSGSIEEYIKKYPALQKPEGYTLVLCMKSPKFVLPIAYGFLKDNCSVSREEASLNFSQILNDFNSMYPGYNDNLYLNFPVTKPNLIKILTSKKTKDIYHCELVQLSKAADEELTNLAAILSLPELISPSVVLVTAQDRDSSGPSAPKKLKGNKNRRWKPSKAESREAFVAHIKDDSYLQVTLQKRHEIVTERGLTPQPYVAVVGPTLSTIKSYLVIVNPNTFYKQRNILESVDTCFKITWALNAEYSSDSYGPWYFIQKSFYKLSSPHDKGSTSAESLMTDCNLLI